MVSDSEKLHFLPTDCYIIHFLLNGRISTNHQKIQAGQVWVQSPASALSLHAHDEDTEIFSIFIKPNAYAALSTSKNSLIPQLYSCCQLFQRSKISSFIFNSTTLRGSFHEGLRHVESCLGESAKVPDWLEHMISPIDQTYLKENSRKDLPLCERHFRRKFKQIMGLTPSLFFRLQRFHHALRLRKENPALELMDIISLCDFYDYSHFTREFKCFAGDNPSTFFQHPQAYRELMIPSLLFGRELA